ncbi:MAG: hypothetical protein Q8O67_19380 [Deltaproteobacteria bacterium]|nr:hypothetical protein [Deltaproteobacteria bacterium]
MIAAVLTLCLVVPLESFDPPPLLDERPPVIDPAGDPPPMPVAPEPEPVPLLPVAPAPPPAPTTTTTPAPDAIRVAPGLPDLDGFSVPAVMAGALVGGGGTAAVGLLFVASAHDVIGVGIPANSTSELLGWALLASAPAFGGFIAGAVALLFLDGAGLDDWANLMVCTTMAWVGTFALVAVAALVVAGGGGSGCNPSGCNPGGCGSCGNGCGNGPTDDGDLLDGPANAVAAGAVFGAFAGGGIGAAVMFFSKDENDPRMSLYLAAAAAAGAAIGAPIGAAIPAIGID